MKTQERLYGIDLLKMYSMFLVVVLHALGRWQLLETPTCNMYNSYYVSWWLETFSYCAVNIFALLTGYISYKSVNKGKLNLKRILVLWSAIVFYGICNLLLKLLLGEPISFEEIYITVFPIINNTYWYFTEYVALFFILPIIMTGISEISKKLSVIILIVTFFFFTVIELNTGNFIINSGYSLVWLAILSIWGGIISKLEITQYLSIPLSMFCIFFLNLISWYLKLFKIGPLGGDNWVSYLSPTMVLIAFLWISIFERITISSKFFRKYIPKIGQGAFSVFIFNTDRFVYDRIIHGMFASNQAMPGSAIIFRTISCAFCFVCGVLIIDIGRQYLFMKIYYLASRFHNNK